MGHSRIAYGLDTASVEDMSQLVGFTIKDDDDAAQAAVLEGDIPATASPVVTLSEVDAVMRSIGLTDATVALVMARLADIHYGL